MAGDLNGTIVSALEELGATVGLLRQAGDPDSPLEPAPGLAQLPGLADSFGSAGLAVTNDSSGPPSPAGAVAPSSGYGLIGMRERALSAGGRLRAGHRPAGGFEVAADLPLHPRRPPEDHKP